MSDDTSDINRRISVFGDREGTVTMCARRMLDNTIHVKSQLRRKAVWHSGSEKNVMS